MDWDPIPKAADVTETRLIEAILSGHFPIDSTLPGERDLAAQLGVTRPTLREALQRLARDGWLEIQHGKATRVCNYWEEGNLAVLATVARHPDHLPDDFVPNLLFVRQVMAPAYARLAVSRHPDMVEETLAPCLDLDDDAEAFALADWHLHHQLTICSGNPVFTLILNGFRDLYPIMGRIYFLNPDGREASRQFYAEMQASVLACDPDRAAAATRDAMVRSQEIWQSVKKGSER